MRSDLSNKSLCVLLLLSICFMANASFRELESQEFGLPHDKIIGRGALYDADRTSSA